MQSLRGTRILLSINKINYPIRLKSTVDDKEVLHFKNLLNSWWEPNGPIQALHSMNYLRVPYVRDGLIGKTPPSKYSNCLKDFKVLDVGCGGGINSEDLAKFGAQVTGIDASKDLIDLANKHSRENKQLDKNRPTYICTTIEEYANEFPDHYDGVVVTEVLEHVKNEDKALFLKSCAQVTKPGGRLFFTTPTRSRITQCLGIYFSEFFNIIPKGTHQYEKFMVPEELKYYLEMREPEGQAKAVVAMKLIRRMKPRETARSCNSQKVKELIREAPQMIVKSNQEREWHFISGQTNGLGSIHKNYIFRCKLLDYNKKIIKIAFEI